jgi:hypothetical protein
VREKSSKKKDRVHFTSTILPPDLRRSKASDELISWLNLKGVSTGDFVKALQTPVAKNSRLLSPSNFSAPAVQRHYAIRTLITSGTELGGTSISTRSSWQQAFAAQVNGDCSKKLSPTIGFVHHCRKSRYPIVWIRDLLCCTLWCSKRPAIASVRSQ